MNVMNKAVAAGIEVGDGSLVGRAIDFAREQCEDYLFNHCMRSWQFAERIGQLRGLEPDHEVLALSVLLHDVTLDTDFAGPRRFVV